MMTFHTKPNRLGSGANHVLQGIRLVWHPKLRAYILVPVLVNIILFIVLTTLLITQSSAFMDWLFSFLPDVIVKNILQPAKWLFWIILAPIFLVIYGYSFNVITNLIAAPFYGLLAEKTEMLLTGEAPPNESLLRMLPRVISRELSKLIYFLFRGSIVLLIILLVTLIPVVNIAAPLIGLLWGAWSMAIQYADYPADNHRLPFGEMRNCLWRRSQSSLGFGALVMLASVIPVVNIFAMPAAVTGGVVFWLSELKECQQYDKERIK